MIYRVLGKKTYPNKSGLKIPISFSKNVKPNTW